MAGNIKFGDQNSSLQVGNNYGTITTGNSPEGSDRRTHREKVLASLKFKEIDSRKLNITNSLKETCEWLLSHEDYKTWLDEKELPQHHGFFWISGKPGAGKSTIMKFACLDMKNRCRIKYKTARHDNPVIASFFFNARGEDLEKSIQGLYRSLLVQVLEGFPDLQVVLENEDLIPQVAQDESISCPPLNVLKELFHDAIALLGKRALTCFIDALDECDENDISDMVDHFEDITEQALSQSSSFRICFSSRHYPHIILNYGIRLTLESQPGHSRDLEFYISTRMKIKEADHRRKLKSRLLGKAAGVFLWVVLVVRILNQGYRRAGFNLEQRLEELPSDLSQLFEAMLLRDTESPEDLLLCILWILYAKRPLSPEEFYHAMWSGLAMKKQNLVDEALPEMLYPSSDASNSNTFNSGEPDKVTLYVISSSKGLAEVTRAVQSTKKRTDSDGDDGRRVQFIHEYVRDFLVKDKGLSDMWPGLKLSDAAMAHDVLKQCCRFYMDHEINNTRPCDPASKLNLKSEIGQTLKSPWLRSKASLNKETATIPRGYVFLDYELNMFYPMQRLQRHQSYKMISYLHFLFFTGKKPSLLPQRRDINVHASGGNIDYPLFVAIRISAFDTVAALLNIPSHIYKGVDIIRREDLASNTHALPGIVFWGTPLSWAARNGRFEIVELLLSDNTVPVNDGRKTEPPALVAAIRNGHKDIARLLVENGADVNHHSPLSHASSIGHEDMVKILLEKGADINYESPLAEAASGGHEATVRLLIKNGASLDKGFPLRRASIGGHETVVGILIESGADVNQKDPLIEASKKGHAVVVKLLVSGGADVNAQDEAGVTPLLHAAQKNHRAVMKLLIDYGADMDHEDNYGTTPRRMMSLHSATKASVAPWSRGRKELFN